MMKNKGIAFKLSVLILSCALAIFFVIFGYNYLFSREIIIRNAKENAQNLARGTVNKIQVILTSVEKSCENVVYFQEETTPSKKLLFDLLHSVVESNPAVFGSCVAFEPFAFDKDSYYFAPYAYRDKSGIESRYLGGESYNYFQMDWYMIPKELHHAMWSEPYFDEGGGNIIMSTYSVPIYKLVEGKKRFIGIATADLSLDWLDDIVSSIKMYETGYAFLVSKNGTIITHPNNKFIMNETVFSVAEARHDPHLRKLGRAMVSGKSGIFPFKKLDTGQDGWMIFEPLAASGWSLGVFIPEEELMASLFALNRTMIVLGLAGFTILLVVIIYIANSITRPLRALTHKTHDISSGNLDVELPPAKSRDEVGQLSESFNSMRLALKEYIEQLTEATAAKERIESELKIAREIQMSTLPKIFPPFPDDPQIDLFALIEPAREVGGDFYDFFSVDDDRLCFVIGDVSGKGVPASLFMAITKTLIKVTTTPDSGPEEILYRVNNELARDNEASMFVTVFLGILNKNTGEVHYANGGHNLPLIMHEKDGIEFIERTKGVVVGAMEDMDFEVGSLQLSPGDSLFLYTDGVTEAMNEQEELFSDPRLKEDLEAFQGQGPRKVADGIMGKIADFTKGAAQSDDITMLILQFRGEPPKSKK